jgi:hypothetical protein
MSRHEYFYPWRTKPRLSLSRSRLPYDLSFLALRNAMRVCRGGFQMLIKPLSAEQANRTAKVSIYANAQRDVSVFSASELG